MDEEDVVEDRGRAPLAEEEGEGMKETDFAVLLLVVDER